MSKDTKSGTETSSLLLGLLGIAFIVLKLCKVINWSWWWVTAPFWGAFAVVLLIIIIAFIVHLVNRRK